MRPCSKNKTNGSRHYLLYQFAQDSSHQTWQLHVGKELPVRWRAARSILDKGKVNKKMMRNCSVILVIKLTLKTTLKLDLWRQHRGTGKMHCFPSMKVILATLCVKSNMSEKTAFRKQESVHQFIQISMNNLDWQWLFGASSQYGGLSHTPLAENL